MLQTRDLIWALLFFAAADLGFSSKAPLQITISPHQGEVSVGESKFFQCTVNREADDISWYSPTGKKLESNQQEISVVRNDEVSSTLTIYYAGIDDAGIYRCVATADGKEAEATVSFMVFQKLTFLNVPSPQEFNDGDDANIICNVTSSPAPTVIWKHAGKDVTSKKDVRFSILGNKYLQIRGIKKTDEGTYRCEGRILARGEIDFRDIKVIVNIPPTIRTRHAELNATADIGASVTLSCDADGFPEPSVSWARNKVVLERGDKYSFNSDGSEMTIFNVKKIDQGEYTCIAKNKAGEKEQEISLNVFVKPKITFAQNKTALELDDQVLTCEAIGDPTPSIVWRFGHRVFSEGEQTLDGSFIVRSDARVSSLTLKNIQYTDAGQYICTATNAIGQDSKSMFLEVHYSPKLQGTVAVYTWEGNPVNITCEVLAHPQASVIWFRDGQQLPSSNATNIKIHNTPTSSLLEITPDSQSDFGNYNCTASNRIGQDSKEFLLIQAEVPSTPMINIVEPFSSTAKIEFEEPDSSGGVPVLKYKAEWRELGNIHWFKKEYDARDVYAENLITISGLKPETNYEVRMSAINGKGEGEFCQPSIFKTAPVRYFYSLPTLSTDTLSSNGTVPITDEGEPSMPKLEGTIQDTGNTLKVKVKWIKQDDGGSPIKHYLVRYKAKQVQDWKPEIKLPALSDYAVITGLEWNTEYEVSVEAVNQQGKSKPAIFMFRTSPQPTAMPGKIAQSSGLSTGGIVGILIVVFLILLVAVDVTCYFLNKCGLLMCIAVNFCGKSGPGAKGKDIEEGKAAFSKDESKEPIVEVRTEDERTPNHDGGSQTEPNETTPLTEPEHPADTTATVEDMLPSVATNSDTITETFATAQNSPTSETTTLTSSTAAPGPDIKSAPVQQASTPKASVTSPTSPAASTTDAAPKVARLVDLSEVPPANSTASPSLNSTAATNAAEPAKAASSTKAPAPAAPVASPAAAVSNTPSEKPKTEATKSPESETAQSNTVKSSTEAVTKPTSPKSSAPPEINEKPSQNEDFQMDGGPFKTSDIDLATDVFAALGSAPVPSVAGKPAPELVSSPADSTNASAPAKDEKTPIEDKTKPEEVENKKPPTEVKTIPNEATQTNANESKA
ncbi:neural cell adhesion molecule 1a isoform X7 [Polypterus senegalus]|uniref:neural cell adhesion molecule 1a isoform X7 n=1 Tax=Polypterus senegalus TaxID=55291 RepID=UPI0019648E2F|nr:neural cell adhesion molecule 1a isoform X7 [Polypterus senegalus]